MKYRGSIKDEEIILIYIIVERRKYMMATLCEQKLKKIIADCGTGIDVSEIDNGTDLLVDLKYDSISIIQMIIEIENQFDI